MKKNTLYRILFVTAIVLLGLGLLYLALHRVLPELLPILRNGDAAEMEAYLQANSTFKGVLCTALLQMLQVWSVVISGVPIQIAAGVVYGTLGGFAICHLSSALAHVLELLAIRRLGKRLEKWLPTENGGSSKLDFVRRSDSPAYTVVLACLIPVLPNGVIPVVAAKTNIKPWQYFLAVWGGSIPAVLLCCAVGSQILRGSWFGTIVMTVLLVLLVLLLWKYQDKVLALLRRVFPEKKR